MLLPNPKISIQLLSKSTLAAAIALADRVFPWQSWWEKASYAFNLSLSDHFVAKALLAIAFLRWAKYWVALQESDDGSPTQVLGITGVYQRWGDRQAYWLGWTCVAPEARGRGLGKELVNLAIAQAQAAQMPYMRLYTTTDPDHAIARQLYEKIGFRLTGSQTYRPYNLLYYELKLSELKPSSTLTQA